MSVAGSISSALERFGRRMTLRRNAAGPGGVFFPLDVSVFGTADGYAPDELIGGLTQEDVKVIFSNKEIAAAQWPGPPKINDQLIIDGRTRTIRQVWPKFLGTTVLVYECQAR